MRTSHWVELKKQPVLDKEHPSMRRHHRAVLDDIGKSRRLERVMPLTTSYLLGCNLGEQDSSLRHIMRDGDYGVYFGLGDCGLGDCGELQRQYYYDDSLTFPKSSLFSLIKKTHHYLENERRNSPYIWS
jgi:hypothetical protein